MSNNIPSTSVGASDRNFEKIINEWLNKEEGDDFSDDSDSEYVQCSDHETDSEQSIGDNEAAGNFSNNQVSLTEFSEKPKAEIEINEKNYYYGKNRFKWAKVGASRAVRTPAHNILRISCRKDQYITVNSSPLDIFQSLIDEDILNIFELNFKI